MGYTPEGGGWWTIELQPTMEEEAQVGGGSRGFLVDLTSNNPNKRLEKLKGGKNEVEKKRCVCVRESNVTLYIDLSHSFYIADETCFIFFFQVWLWKAT